jgi:manganese efflux pump family protein
VILQTGAGLSALQLAVVAVTISLDTFAAAIALGTQVPRRLWFRIALVFAVVGGVAPLLGLTLGTIASGFLASLASGLGVLVLAALGGWFLHSAVTRGAPSVSQAEGEILSDSGAAGQPWLTPGPLFLLALGLSSDNVLVGLGLGLQGGVPALLGGVTALSVFAATLTGLTLGSLGMARFGRGALGMAGLLLLGLALAFLLRGV